MITDTSIEVKKLFKKGANELLESTHYKNGCNEVKQRMIQNVYNECRYKLIVDVNETGKVFLVSLITFYEVLEEAEIRKNLKRI